MANLKHIAKSGDTFTTLSKYYYNDESVANLLASFNKMAPTVALADGAEINILARFHIKEKVVQENGKPVMRLKEIRRNLNVLAKGDSGDIVEEINIRLSGFGGGVPTSTFDDVTELKVKQFQKDYMKKASPSGKVDEETAKAIDEFGGKYGIDFDQLKCTCGSCTGFGNSKYKDKYSTATKEEVFYKYEYPGVHRMLLWGIRGLMFYLESEKNPELEIGKFYSVYRCWEDNTKNSRTSTNHMGKAADLHIYTKSPQKDWSRPTDQAENIKLCNKVRDICVSKMNAQIEWYKNDRFALEPPTGTVKADTWVHIDVRMLNHTRYLLDRFFVKDTAGLNGDKMLTLLKEMKS